MNITCAQDGFDFSRFRSDLNVALYGHIGGQCRGAVGFNVMQSIRQSKLSPAPRAWDLLSIALAVVSADLAQSRKLSADGWTREYELGVSLADAPFWNRNLQMLQRLLCFLTTDRWRLHFLDGGVLPIPVLEPVIPEEDCVVLLSGGLDSLIGAIDITSIGKRAYAVSQLVRGDAVKQNLFARGVGGGLRHIQLNHNAHVPNQENPPSQRARSLVFLAYGILAASSLARYHAGEEISLYVCENGFIALNPPLTSNRIGSLSTRTAHPVVLSLLQQLLDAAELHVKIINPYQYKTKGEMLQECKDQQLLSVNAFESTSCGRFRLLGYRHCGRCVPCLIRRAAFHKWGKPDLTKNGYLYSNLGVADCDHAYYDDVRAAVMGIVECRTVGIARWIGTTISSPLVINKDQSRQTVTRGLSELESFLNQFGLS